MSTSDDQYEIRNIIARLGLLADNGDLGEYLDLFTPDAVWDMPGSPRTGHDDILEGATERRASGMTGPGSNTRHLLSTIAVDVEAGSDEATSESVFQFWVETTTSPHVQIMGHYADTFRRGADGWKLANRSITFG